MVMLTPPSPKRPAPSVEYLADATHAAGQFVRPSMHKLMLEDFYRTLSFRNAMLLQVKPGMHVLEIGTGTGILCHFALEAGAEHVTTIESTAFAGIARDILAANGLADRVTVIEGLSFDIELPNKADLLITETLGHAGYEEGILHTAWDARQRLLKPRAPIMPGAFTIFAAPVRGNSFAQMQEFWAKEQFGLRMDVLNTHLNKIAYITRFRDPEMLGQPAPFVTCIVGDEPQFPLTGDCKMSVHQAGRCFGLEISFTTALGNLTLESRSTTSWQQVFMPFLTPIDLRPGEQLAVTLHLERPSDKGVFRGGGTGHVVGDATRSVVLDITGSVAKA